jgi:hypothetical protein
MPDDGTVDSYEDLLILLSPYPAPLVGPDPEILVRVDLNGFEVSIRDAPSP